MAVDREGQMSFSTDDTESSTQKGSSPATTHALEDEKDDSDLSIIDRDALVTTLARSFTHASVRQENEEYINPFLGGEDSSIDPTSEQFSTKAWVKTLLGISSQDPDRYPRMVSGITFRNLSVHGHGTPKDYQKTFGNIPLELLSLHRKIMGRHKTGIQILKEFDGIVNSGEMLVVLGRPGSGCSTLLKTISGETNGISISEDSYLNYRGIDPDTMHKNFRGECIYQAEVDVHFPQLTVSQTLEFAAACRTPSNRFSGVSRNQYAAHLKDVAMAIFGLSHTKSTRVGNDFIRGVSGGERKRVSIAEAWIARSAIQCWDNSTRGLDSATAHDFIKTLKVSTELGGSAAIVAIYQASQSVYEIFDKVTVLYEGRQIYFGNIHKAKKYFVNLGFECPPLQTTPDFLTSLTSPPERIVRNEFEANAPRTPDEFAEAWRNSEDRAELLRDIAAYEQTFPVGGEELDRFRNARGAQQARHLRLNSPYTISIFMQVKVCMKRGIQRLEQDMSLMITGIIGNSITAVIVGSVFYNTENTTSTLFSRGALLFFAVLLNAFSSSLEILTLYAQRPIVEKHTKYAFYHPFAEAISSMICDLPNKFLSCTAFTLVLYFMTNLRREVSAFFTFYLFCIFSILCMSMMFRSIASLTRTVSEALVPSAILILGLIIYTGFSIPVGYMQPFFRWINYIDPVAYAFEALMINEFGNRKIKCDSFIPSGPSYDGIGTLEQVCNAIGSRPGEEFLDGNLYLAIAFNYDVKNLWRNLWIIIAFTVAGLVIYILAAEFISAANPKGEVLRFLRRPGQTIKGCRDEEVAQSSPSSLGKTMVSETSVAGTPTSESTSRIKRQTTILHWDSICYDIKVKGGTRRLLDQVDGWVKPGTVTALMGVSGAGKTTLLDVLASRATMGVVTGEVLVNGCSRDSTFQRKTGYVQQQDLHLATSTVREALQFSAVLRQPSEVSLKEKYDYVDEIIKVLGMESFAEAIVGVLGEGLNVEQRKRLTIGVEMVAKPELLFLDEPTSGLDSQTAWSISTLLRKLANNGQAILCTIHQPSAILFQTFDRLLLLAKEGKPVYFGDIGEYAQTMKCYFERHGARTCDEGENPAEWMLEVIGAAPGSTNKVDWTRIWKNSAESQEAKSILRSLKTGLSGVPSTNEAEQHSHHAAGFWRQLHVVTNRVFVQYWRTPVYLYSKVILCLASALFIGFSFYGSPRTIQGMQNQLLAIFMLFTIFGNISQQIMPHFAVQRSLYEARERPSKIFSWQVFILSQIIVELPWNTLMSFIIFPFWYYPTSLYKNAIDAVGGSQLGERSGLMLILVWGYLMFISTFTNMVIAGIETPETAGSIAGLFFSLCLVFCGVLATPGVFPGFWIFMYRVSPFTYIVDALLSVGLANTYVVCDDNEYLHFQPPLGQTCGEYMDSYINGDATKGTRAYGGYVLQPNATANCQFCTISETNTWLATLSASYDHRWRNVGLIFVYVVFNAGAAVFLYWLVRVPKEKQAAKHESKRPTEEVPV